MDKADTYQIITDRIIAALEAGTVPWRRPWKDQAALRNMRGTHYHGVNVFILGCAPYSCPVYATFNQIRAAGGMVKKGEHGWPVTFWHFFDKLDKDGEKTGDRIPFLKYYTVFNLEQQAGIPIPAPDEPTVHAPIQEAEAIIAGYTTKPEIRHAPGKAYYSPASDFISVPAIGDYQNVEDYYSTLFHECTHSTGHESRLNRNVKNGFGTGDYAREELVAEMGAAFLCARVGIEQATIENTEAYIAGWLTHLKNDKKLVVTAAGKAQKAADYIAPRIDEKTEEEGKDAA